MNRSGQKVNITLIDFLIETSRRNGVEDTSVQPHPQCNVYVIFKELGEEGQFRTICNSTNKETNAILSSAQLLEIRLIRNMAVPGTSDQSVSGYSFMIKYEGSKNVLTLKIIRKTDAIAAIVKLGVIVT